MWLFAQTGWFVRLLVAAAATAVRYNRTMAIPTFLMRVLLDVDETTRPETKANTDCKDYCAGPTDGLFNRWRRCGAHCYSGLDELP